MDLGNEVCTYKGVWIQNVLFMMTDFWGFFQVPQGIHWFSE
jgi:hypothetical protein